VIDIDGVTVTYDSATAPALVDADLHVPEGELCLVVGPTGSGKSTLLRTVNGLVPHFTGGTLRGRVRVDGRDTRDHPPRDLADVVGMVGQDPLAGFVTDLVEEELAYTMESLGVAPATMRRRVEETLDLLGLANVRHRPLRTLSGGQRQRVAIGAVLTAQPRVLVLDEPTSALDPGAAEEVLAALQRLVHDLGVTVLMAEHRLERVVQYADRVARLLPAPGGGTTLVHGDPAAVMADSPVAPAVVELGRLAGWSPLPLSVRDARRLAAPLRARIQQQLPAIPAPAIAPASADVVARAQDVTVRYGTDVWALRNADLTVRRGEVVAVMGRNGAGKSTLLGALAGLVRPVTGTVDVAGADPAGLRGEDLLHHVGFVPQDAADLLWSESVGAECAAADEDAHAEPGTARALLATLVPGLDDAEHPRDLSEGQRLALALAVVLASTPPLVLLDEPTRGLDYPSKARLVHHLRALAADGHAVVVATHDVELVADLADRVVVVAEGEIVSDGPSIDVLASSPLFAPQVSKVLAPDRWLRLSDVEAALAATP
jgi:energy-coupling factor transporter ATP-binding protein EcfA2